ncbi:hypothetical protein BRPE67_ACDS18170 [Caballeronia cordobensis]|nr:hypothetical protein BRPE67_ACDS18170 [Burkholderia sp. RPE67]
MWIKRTSRFSFVVRFRYLGAWYWIDRALLWAVYMKPHCNKLFLDSCRAATKVMKFKRPKVRELVLVRNPEDRLGIVAFAINNQKIVSGFAETVFVKENVAPLAVEFFNSFAHRVGIVHICKRHLLSLLVSGHSPPTWKTGSD